MGARLTTTFENRSSLEMEVRVFVPPDRPDHFRKIIRIKPGEKKQVLVKCFCDLDTNPERAVMILVFVEGVYTGVSLLPRHVLGYNKVIWDRSEVGLMHLRGIKNTLTDFCRPRLCFVLPLFLSVRNLSHTFDIWWWLLSLDLFVKSGGVPVACFLDWSAVGGPTSILYEFRGQSSDHLCLFLFSSTWNRS